MRSLLAELKELYKASSHRVPMTGTDLAVTLRRAASAVAGLWY